VVKISIFQPGGSLWFHLLMFISARKPGTTWLASCLLCKADLEFTLSNHNSSFDVQCYSCAQTTSLALSQCQQVLPPVSNSFKKPPVQMNKEKKPKRAPQSTALGSGSRKREITTSRCQSHRFNILQSAWCSAFGFSFRD
jgi:hypothetical protein